MNRLMTIFLLSLATAGQAGEVKIVETESEIIVEYTGAPSSTVSDSNIPAAAAENVNATRVIFLTSQIEQLKMELAEKKQKIEFYEEEIRRMSGKSQTEAVQKDASPSGTRRETTRRLKELRQSRKASSAAIASEE